MLMLPFSVGNDCYAIGCETVIEVVPRVNLKKVPHVPDYIPGMLNFGGLPIAVVDMCQLLENRFVSPALHTRIVLVEKIENDEHQYLGIMGEKITETLDVDRAQFIDSGIVVKDFPYLKGILNLKEGPIQFIDVYELFNALKGVIFQFSQANEIPKEV